MTDSKDMSRRKLLARMGLVLGAAYIVPVLTNIGVNEAAAASRSGGKASRASGASRASKASGASRPGGTSKSSRPSRKARLMRRKRRKSSGPSR